MAGVFEVHRALEAFGVLETGAGRQAKRIVAWGATIGAATGLAVVAGIVIATVPVVAADNAYWSVSGPPCPVATPAGIHRIGRPLAQVIDFGEGRFARISGAVVCTDLIDGAFGLVKGTACQFNSPRALGVWSDGGSSFYDIPRGLPATVTVSRTGPPRCVLAAHYGGD